MDNTPDLGKAVSSFTKLQGLGRNVAGFPRPHTTQPVSLGLTASLPFLGSTPDFVSPGTGQGLRGICRRHQTRRGSEKPGQRQRTGEETQPGSLAPPPGWDREGLHREQEEVQRPGPVQDTHPRAPCSLPLCAHFSIERIFTVTTSQRVSYFSNYFHMEAKPEVVFLSGTLASCPSKFRSLSPPHQSRSSMWLAICVLAQVPYA